MAPLPTIVGGYYGRIIGSFEGRPSTNIFAWRMTPTAITPSADFENAQEIANLMVSDWNINMTPILPESWSGTTAEVYPLGSPTMPAAVATTAATGAIAGNLAPVSTAFVIEHTVTRRGRGSQSRTFLSPVSLNTITADGVDITPGHKPFVQTGFDDFISLVISDFAGAFAGFTLEYVQLSKKGAGALYSITTSVVEDKLSTQTKRAQR